MNHPNQGSAPPLNQTNYNAAPTAINTMPARKAVNIIAMGSSRTDFFTAQLMETRPEILVDAEIWTINYMAAQIRCDRIVHVDPVHPYLGHPPVRDMCEFALKDNIPLYTSWPHPKYPNQVIYPFDRVSASLGGITYFNTSVAYAIALAMADGFNEIGLFGCDFSYPDVHMAESGRACCEFLMGIGTQRGIRFAVAQSSTLMDMYCKQAPYGFFADPNLPPNNGGRLMTAGEVMQHVHKTRNPPKKLAEYVIAVKAAVPQIMQTFVEPQDAAFQPFMQVVDMQNLGNSAVNQALAQSPQAFAHAGGALADMPLPATILADGSGGGAQTARAKPKAKARGKNSSGDSNAPDSLQLPNGNGG